MKTYLNGLGHIIITLAVLAMCTFLLYTDKLNATVVTGLLGTVIGFWFLSGVGTKAQVQAIKDASPPDKPVEEKKV